MKKIMFTLLLAAISTGAMAEWIRVSDGMLYDSTSIQKVGDIVTIEIAVENSQTGNERYHYSEYQFDCKIAGKYRIYAGGIPFKGSVSSEWFIVPDDRLWPIACSKASNSSAPTYGKQPTPPASAPTRESSGPVTATIEKGEQGSSGGGGAFWIIGVVVALALLLWKVLGSTVQDDTPSKLLATKRLLIVALALDAMVGLLLCINAFYTKGVLKEVQSGTRVFSESILASLTTWDTVSKFSVLTTIVVGVCLVRWISACYRYSEDVIGAEGFEQKGWKFWGWVIPIIWLYKPYKVLSEIYRAGSSYEGKTGWMQTNASGGLLAWWIAYSIIRIVGFQTGKWMWKLVSSEPALLSKTPASLLADLISFYGMRGWLFVLSLIVCAMWLKLINTFTDRLITRSAVDEEPSDQEASEEDRVQSTMPVPSVLGAETAIKPIDATVLKVANDDWAYEAVSDELNGKRNIAAWTRAFADADGDENKAKALYISRRVDVLKREKAAKGTGPAEAPKSQSAPSVVNGTDGGNAKPGVSRQLVIELVNNHGVSVAEAEAMISLGITPEKGKFRYKGYVHDDLAVAVLHAKRDRRGGNDEK